MRGVGSWIEVLDWIISLAVFPSFCIYKITPKLKG